MRKLLLRIPALRWCALQYLKSVREKQARARQLQIDATLMTIGNIVIAWAALERFLDEIIASYQIHATSLTHEHPKMLYRKLQYLRLMQCDKRFNDKTREWLRKTRLEINRLRDKRHDAIHGVLWRRSVKGNQWQSQRIVYDGPYARLQTTNVTQRDLHAVLSEITAFNHDLAPKVWVLTRGDLPAYTSGDIEKAKRQLGMID